MIVFSPFGYKGKRGDIMVKVLVLLAEGFEEVEALTPVDYLRRIGIDVIMVSITQDLKVKGSHGIEVLANKTIDDIQGIINYRGIIIPGGMPGASNLRDNEKVIELVQNFNDESKMVAAICAGPIVLQRAGIINNKKVTSYPGFESELKDSIYKKDIVVQDGNIITARGPAAAVYFSIKIAEHLKGEEKGKEIKKAILLDLVEKR